MSALNFQDLFMLGLEEVYKAPLHNHCILDTRGEVELNRLNEAVLRLLDEYPVMKMKTKAGRLTHVSREPIHDPGENIVDFLDLGGEDPEKYDTEVANFINAPINVWEELPFKILLIRKERNRCTILIKMHHYVTDGIGAVCFVNALIGEYSGMSSGSRQTHTNRSMLSVVPHGKLFRKHLFLRNISDVLARYINASFLPSARLAGGHPDAQGSVNFLHKVLRPEELSELRGKARTAQVTLNDYFVAASILAIDRWNSKRGGKSGRIGVEVPVNLRPRGSFYRWVGNWCSSASVSTRPGHRVDFDTLLRKVNSRTRSISENGLAYTLVYMSAWTRFFPFGVIKFLSRLQAGTGADTTVVSFLGNVIRFQESDEIEVSKGVAFGPVCHKTGCSLWLYLFRDKLNITFAYRDTLLTTDEAREFLSLFVHRLQS